MSALPDPPAPKGSPVNWKAALILAVIVFAVGGAIAWRLYVNPFPDRPAPAPEFNYAPPAGGGGYAPSEPADPWAEDPADPWDTGYENPAPGDDGSFDCPPGGGPVYVGDDDPAGLDGDGDGIGCE
ncbi:MAG: hypothetical protein WD556_03240 [Actinomycetota bacterium]